MSNLFIPKTIRVGYQERKDTFTGKLAYVIYYDSQGKLRKETSWERWRDEEIEPEEFENKPTTGFVLNKEARRYNWSHFGSNRSYIRMYDPRGIEFEITPDNLVGVLMECNCSKRMMDSDFIYAWAGTELVLLPCASESYQEAIEYTKRQAQKVSAKDLIEGCSYTKKNGDEVVYLGRFPWYTWDGDKGRTMKRQHVFYENKYYAWKRQYEDSFSPIANIPSALAHINSPEPVQNYAKLVDQLKKKKETLAIAELNIKPNPIKELEIDTSNNWHKMNILPVIKKTSNGLQGYIVELRHYNPDKNPYFIISKQHFLNLETLTTERNYERNTHFNYYSKQYEQEAYSQEEILDLLQDCVILEVVFEDGTTKIINKINYYNLDL